MRRFVIGLIVLAVLGGGGYYAYTLSTQTDEAESTETVDVNEIALDTGISNVSAEGRVVPLDDAVLAFQVGGELAEILVNEGEAVNAGEPILRLDDTDQQIALSQAQAGLAQAEANVKTAEAGLISAQAGLEASRVGVDSAQAQLDLLSSGATAEQIGVSEAAVAAADAGISAAAGQSAATFEGATSAQVQAAQAELEAARANVVPIQIAVNNYRNKTVEASKEVEEQAERQLQAALAQVAAAEARVREVQAGATAPERVAAAAGVDSAEASRDASQAELALLLAGSREEDIVVAQIGVDQAINSVTEAELAVSQAEVGVAQAQTAVTEAQKAIESAESAIQKTILVAPFDGIVATINLKVGQIVVGGAPIVTLADFNGWQVLTTDLTELNVVSVAVGMPVEVTVDAFPNETLSGTVTDISSVSDLVLGDVTYAVTVDLDESDLPLRWGMTAFATVDVDQ